MDEQKKHILALQDHSHDKSNSHLKLSELKILNDFEGENGKTKEKQETTISFSVELMSQRHLEEVNHGKIQNQILNYLRVLQYILKHFNIK